MSPGRDWSQVPASTELCLPTLLLASPLLSIVAKGQWGRQASEEALLDATLLLGGLSYLGRGLVVAG